MLIENYKSEVFVFSIVISSTATSKKYITLPNKRPCLPSPALITRVFVLYDPPQVSPYTLSRHSEFYIDPARGKHCSASGSFHSRSKSAQISSSTQHCLVDSSLSHTPDQECSVVHVYMRTKSIRDLVSVGLQGSH